MSIHQTLFATYDNPMIVCDSADFDGTNDDMRRGAGLTGAADSKLGIFSAWARLDTPANGDVILNSEENTFFVLLQGAPGAFRIRGVNPSASIVLDFQSVSTFSGAATWRHLLASWDLGAGITWMYINDVADKVDTTVTDSLIDYTQTNWRVGVNPLDVTRWDGCLAEIYFAPGQYLDFSLVHNRRKFISASGKPVHLGTTGALPTATAPLMYHHIDDAEAVANFATNRGTGGDFTITGTLDTGSTSPSD